MADTRPTCAQCDQSADVTQPIGTHDAPPSPLCHTCAVANQAALAAERQAPWLDPAA